LCFELVALVETVQLKQLNLCCEGGAEAVPA